MLEAWTKIAGIIRVRTPNAKSPRNTFALPPKADTCSANRGVRLGPKADIQTGQFICSNCRFESEDRVPIRKSKTRSNHLSLVLAVHHSPGSYKKSGKHQSAFAQRLDVRILGR